MPIPEFVSYYSKTLGSTIKQIFNIVTNLIIFTPIILISLSVSLLITNDSLNFVLNINEISQTFILSTLIFTSILIILGSELYYRSKRNAIFTALLLFVGSTLYYLLETPSSYVILIGLLYGLGGYVSTLIEFKTPYNHYYVYKKLSPQDNIINISIISGIIIFITSVFSVYSINYFTNENIILGISLLSGIVSYLASYLQIPHYKDIYNFVDLKVQSQFWILVPQVSIIVATGLKIIGNIDASIYIILMLSPSISGVIFSKYINGQIEGLSSNQGLSSGSAFYTLFSDSHHKSGKVNVRPHQEIDVESNFNPSTKSASLKFTAKIEIPDKFPEDFADMPWYEIAIICDRLDQTSKLMRNADQREKEKINRFYTKITERAINELKESGNLKDFKKIPDSFLQKIRYEIHNIEGTDISDINYFEVKSERPIKKQDRKYVESN